MMSESEPGDISGRAVRQRGCRGPDPSISVRVLVLARKHLHEVGITCVCLACSDGELPAFPPSSFEIVAASDVIEHTPSPAALVAARGDLLVPEGLPSSWPPPTGSHCHWNPTSDCGAWGSSRARWPVGTFELCAGLPRKECRLSRSLSRRCPSPRKVCIAGSTTACVPSD